MDAIRAGREDGQPDDAEEQVEPVAESPRRAPSKRAREEHAEGLQGQRHVLVDGHVEADPTARPAP